MGLGVYLSDKLVVPAFQNDTLETCNSTKSKAALQLVEEAIIDLREGISVAMLSTVKYE